MSKSTTTTTSPFQVQPTVEGQPYRSFPYFNVDRDGKRFAESGQKQLQDWLSNVDWESRPQNAVVKLILMTMDEWPLLKSWVMYHGKLLGYQNLYIIDSSTDTRCTSFLRYARDILGANVLFSNANLNELESLLTDIGQKVSGSSDFILKVDTDEFLTVHDGNGNSDATASGVLEYLSGFAQNETHPLRLLPGNARVGHEQKSIPSESVCEKDIHSTPDNFPLGEPQDDPHFKMVYDSRVHITKINLGGHNIEKSEVTTQFNIIHYHSRCIEIELENTRRVLERHDFISPADSDEQVKVKLAKKFGCSTEDMCNTCPFERGFVSNHKARFYLQWLDCKEQTKKEYYAREGNFNMDLNNFLKESYERSDV